MRIVIDTNVFVSQLIIPNSVSDRAIQNVVRNHTLILNDVLFSEIAQTLQKPKLAKYLSAKTSAEYLARLEEKITPYPIRRHVTICRDPKDNKVLELALAAKASLILTGDLDLLSLHPFKGIELVSPGRYIRGQ